MGVDARWMCHTCKTMCCADGARSVLNHDAAIEDVKKLLELAPRITDGYCIGGWDYLLKICSNFINWTSRHKGHKIAISNDSSISRDDLPDYRSETVEGEVGDKTFREELDAEAEYYTKNYCPACGSYVGGRGGEK